MDLSSSKDILHLAGGQREIETNKDEKQAELTDNQMICTDELCGLATWKPLHDKHDVREAS